MDEVHVCDLVIGKGGSEIRPQSLAKAERKFGDLFACLTDLYSLKLGEPVWRLLLKDNATHLRVMLVPRRQLLLDLTLNGQRSVATIEEEAELVFSQVQRAQVKVTREARKLVARAKGEPFLPDDPVSKMLWKRSGKQWMFSRGSASAKLKFPGIELAVVDEEPISLQGKVSLATLHRLDLVDLVAPVSLSQTLTKLAVDRSGLEDAEWGGLARIGAPFRANVRLHRCLFTKRVIGASICAPD